MKPIPWHLRAMTGYDCESTGVDPTTDRMVTASLVRITPGQATVTDHHLIDPGVDIPEAATKVHGITTEQARAKGGKPVDVLDPIAADLAMSMRRGVPVVGMNLAYDLTMLEHELHRHGLPTLTERLDGRVRPVVDVLVLDKHVDPYRKGKRRLENLCEHYRVKLDGAHDSSFDAIAACRVAWRIAEVFPAVAEMSLDELHDAQVGWRAEQCASLQDYFRRSGKPDEVVDGSWPLRPVGAGVAA